MTEVPPEQRQRTPPAERGRVHAQGRHIKDGALCTLLFIHEADGSWTIYGLVEPEIWLPSDAMVTLAEAILERTRS